MTKGGSYAKDSTAYRYCDSGCEIATEYMSTQSSCLNCPFKRCIYDEKFQVLKSALKRKRNEAIMTRQRAGAKTKELAKEFCVTQRTIRRVKKNG